ncbi:hypothetical protein SASPL_151777 [Salvia splendens]|uniref:Protein kinase domain-containing protein n=1 Tax=Salvia splendens TaxID=180675 RepID=A0A8X8Z0A9_SALSN|nr:hypothetical protein SASPL_151777 [Salvia splendens]
MIIFFLVIFAGHLAAADPYHISINCGGDAHGGRNWLREGSSTVSTGLITARISRSEFSYSLKLSSGPKIIRLHFQPPSYTGFERSNDLFSVVAGNSSLLANFSASVAGRALAVNVVVKQFCVTVEENETLNLVFSPDWGNSYAFVNEIEIISMPSTTPPYCGGVVAPKPIIHVDNSTALERVHYQHVKWGPVSSGDDIASMFGMWSKQPSVGEDSKMGTNKTWRVSIDARFKYLVRLHLCEAGLHMDFVLLINGRVALTSADMHQQRRGNRELFWYNNYMVVDEELKQGDISISLHSRHKFLDRHGPLEGFEVFKIISHQSVSFLTPLRSLAYSILFYICIVYLEHKVSQYKFTREDNKPLARAKQLSHRFSLARILRICGYGGDGKGFVDHGREIVVIKPLKMDSNQRENKFRNVIEALWGLRHVSLIGHCREHQGVADHFYKLARKSNNFFPHPWKQRLQICGDVAQALEYLHTDPMVIHHDLKPANILTDNKFEARLADFGVTKTVSFSESQNQDSTNLIGTLGYIAPDFITSGEGTKHSDTYSFGALVLEVSCGRAGRESRTKVEDVDYDKIDFGNHEEVELEVLMDSSTDSQKQQLPPGFEFYPTDAELVVYDLKRATRNFRSDLVLGEGGFGSIYKRFMNCESEQCFREWQFLEEEDLEYLSASRNLIIKTRRGSESGRSTMIGTTRGMHAVQVPVIYRDFKASNILLDEVKLGVLMDSLTGSHQWQIDRRSMVNEQPPITAVPTPAKKQVHQSKHNKAHVPARAPAHSDWSKHKMDFEYPPTTLPLQKQACNPQTGVEVINSILLSIL